MVQPKGYDILYLENRIVLNNI